MPLIADPPRGSAAPARAGGWAPRFAGIALGGLLLVHSTGAAAGAPASADSLPPILLSQAAARRANVRVGDVIRVSADPGLTGARAMRVAGVLPVKADPVDIGRGTLWAKLHLSSMAGVTRRPDDVDEVILRARRPADAAALRDRLNSLGLGFHAYTSEELARRTSQTFEVISLFHKAISVITLVAGAVFLLAILLFKVEERKRELGALRLIGIRRRSLLLFLCAEALGISVAGSVAGLGLGHAGALAVNAFYQNYYHTTLVFAAVTPAVAWTSVLLGAGFGLAAGFLVALRVVRTPALDLLGR